MAQQFVKLIPIGPPENKIFAFEVVGGSPGFPGYQAEEFTGTTDGSGQATVVLSRAPAHLAGCFCVLGEDERVMAPVSISASTHLLLQKRKLLYDKPTGGLTGFIHAASLPAGITAASSAANTGDTAPGATSTGPSATTGPVGGAAADAVISVGGVTTTVDAHHHTIDSAYDHKHDLAFTPTSLVAAASEAFRVLVIYA